MNKTNIPYEIGAGIANVTDPAIGLSMQGMADPSQKTSGVESFLYSRAFVLCEQNLCEQNPQRRVAIAVADIWSCTEAVKKEVVKRLQLRFSTLYTEDNVLISGTHTHSGPGGFSKSRLYEHVTGGFDPHNFECIVSGIVESIEKAHFSLTAGRVYLYCDRLPNCGRQRSREAYLNNPLPERLQYDAEADEEILLLKFVTVNDQAEERPIGVLNWHAIHPTDRGQNTSLVNGDNKGYAAYLFEQYMRTRYRGSTDAHRPFVAAFANANCGDVSGNVEFGTVPNGINDVAHMQLHGKKLFAKALEMFECAAIELRGRIDYCHTRIDMANIAIEDESDKRTWPAALGLSFAAGSTEDSASRVKIAGFTIPAPTVKEGTLTNKLSLREKLTRKIIQIGLSFTFGTAVFRQPFTKRSVTKGHWPKPIILTAGLIDPPIVPSVLPLQLLQIGNLVITAVPGELTTMAGRRLRKTLLNELKEAYIQHVALATYANDYALYITTKEEYEKQHYEGAATLYGPHTLAAYQQEFSKLAKALMQNKPADTGLVSFVRSAPTSNRITIRNLSQETVMLSFLRCGMRFFDRPIGVIKVSGESDRAYYLPQNASKVSVVIDNSQTLELVKQHHLLTIYQDGQGRLSCYKKQPTVTL